MLAITYAKSSRNLWSTVAVSHEILERINCNDCAYYRRIPDLEEEFRAAKLKLGAKANLIRKYTKYQVLVLDEWLLEKPDDEFGGILFELMELRYDDRSTIFCVQFKQKDWHTRLSGRAHADAIMNCIVHHNAVWLDIGETNMRAGTAKTLAQFPAVSR